MSKFKRAVLLQLGGMLLLGALIAFLARYFGLIHVIIHMQKKLGEMEIWGGVCYVPLRAACNILLLPGSALTITSGLCFGLWWGFLLSLLGNVLGAAMTFGIGRMLGRDWVEHRLSNYPKWRALDAAIAREGWKIIFLSQLHPLFPLSLLTYLYGVTRIGFWRCMLWIAIAQTPGVFLYTYLGTLAQLGIKVFQGENHPRLVEYVVWIGGLLLALAVALALGRVALKMMAEVERRTEMEAKHKEKSPDLEKSLF
jgi:uncharacterized membrane protein YdjX (TVP38/TMEM64 family)